MNEHEQLEWQRISPRLLVQSFLVMIAAYVAVIVAYYLVFLLLMAVLFPEMLAVFQDEEQFERLRVDDPRAVISHQFAAVFLVAMVLIVLLLGFAVARFVPFAPLGHGIFLAVLVFAFFVQVVIAEDSPMPRWAALSLLASGPPAVLIGAWLATWLRLVSAEEPSEE